MNPKDHINRHAVSTHDGLGKDIFDEAERIAGAVGNNPGVTLSALLIVLAKLLTLMKDDIREQVIDGIPTNIRMNMNISKSGMQ